MSRYRVVEIDRQGNRTPDDATWETRDEAEFERNIFARTAANNWPDLGFQYQVEEADQ